MTTPYIEEKVEEFETKILPEIFNLPEHGRSVRLDPRDAVVVVDWLHIILTEADRRAREEERERIFKKLWEREDIHPASLIQSLYPEKLEDLTPNP